MSHFLTAGGRPPTDGITQTPPAIRHVLEQGLSPTQLAPRGQQAARPAGDAGAIVRTPAAVRDWSDDETVASEPPEAEVAVSDSESDDCSAAPPASTVHPPPQHRSRQHSLLLQVSRPSAGGHGSALRSRVPVSAAASQQQPAAAPAADPSMCLDDGMPSPMGGCEPPADDVEPALWDEPCLAASPAALEQEQQPTTSKAAGGNGGRQQQPHSVRDWSDDGSSGSEEFPSPRGGWVGWV